MERKTFCSYVDFGFAFDCLIFMGVGACRNKRGMKPVYRGERGKLSHFSDFRLRELN